MIGPRFMGAAVLALYLLSGVEAKCVEVASADTKGEQKLWRKC